MNTEKTGRNAYRQKVLIQRQRQNQRLLTGLTILGGFLLLWFGYLFFQPQPTITEKLDSIITVGIVDAPVVVEEFFDFQCSHCRNFVLTQEETLLTKYVQTGRVLLKIIPFSFMGEESGRAAEAAYCAAESEQYLTYRRQLFTSETGLNQNVYLAAAQSLGLDQDTFQTCLESRKYQNLVQANLNYGKQQGIDGTPLFLVNGQRYDSSQLFAAIEAQIPPLTR